MGLSVWGVVALESNEVIIGSAPSRDLARVIVDALASEGIKARAVLGSPSKGASSSPGSVQISVEISQQRAAKEILDFLKNATKNPSPR